MPGTIGTLAGVAIFYFTNINYVIYWSLTFCIIILGVWLSGIAEKDIFKKKDSQHIVIDEVAGYLIAMSFFTLNDHWLYILLGFILFRAFDILKPNPINKLQKLKGGFGVMMDDILAGVYANIILQLIRYFKLI